MTFTTANLTDQDIVTTQWAASGPWLSGDEVIAWYEISAFGAWLLAASAERQLSTLGSLQAGWDSYGGRPIDPTVMQEARRFLTFVASHNLPGPFVIPTSKGGIAFEWRRGQQELAVELDPMAHTAGAFFADDQTGEEWERDLRATWTAFLPALVGMGR